LKEELDDYKNELEQLRLAIQEEKRLKEQALEERIDKENQAIKEPQITMEKLVAHPTFKKV
jgi:hypothetical protein